MAKIEFLCPIFPMEISGKSSTLSPFNVHAILMGRSPVGTKQEICTGCPDETGLSSNMNGVIRGGTRI